MKKILVTGGLGFVGRQLVARLVGQGDQVAVCDLVPDGQSPAPALGAFSLDEAAPIPGGNWRYTGSTGAWELFHCPLEEPESIRSLIENVRPDVIFHLAAQSSAGLSFSMVRETFSANLFGTLNLFEAVRDLAPDRWPTILSIGSCEEYGAVTGRTTPLAEDAALIPVSPYGVSKVAQTKLGQQYHTSFGMPIITVRAFNHIGPDQDTRFAFASFAAQIARIERRSEAAEIAVGDLSPVRDFLDVRDVLTAYCLLVDKGSPGEVYNICSGKPLTIREGLEILLESALCPIEIEIDPARCRPSDIPYLVGDNTKLSRATGWRPEREIRHTLAEMLELARKEQI